MDFALSKELQMLKKAVSEFAAKKIAPYADEWDAKHYFPYKEAIKPMGELGFFGTVIPEKYGGEDMGWLATMIVTEEIAKASSSLRVQVNMQCLGSSFTICKYGNEALKQKYISNFFQLLLYFLIPHNALQWYYISRLYIFLKPSAYYKKRDLFFL